MAKQAYIKGGVNRVILATDGDFNVGTVDQNALETLVADQRKSGIA
jgi:Ca-activated chloride channel family protein